MSTSELLALQDGELLLIRDAFAPDLADQWLRELQQQIAWQQDYLNICGRRIPLPRLQAWYGDAAASYSYSGLMMRPLPWTGLLSAIKKRVEALCAESFNAVLLNRYRNGDDSVGWHADDEPELGHNPVIASLSLGDTRLFRLQHRKNKQLNCRLELEHASLLVMRGATQHHWRHQVPKTTRQVSERINLTFRLIKSSQ